MLRICKELFEEWNSKVRYCHWKGNDHINDGLNGYGDLDVFVLPEDESVAESILHKLSFVKVRQQQFFTYPLVEEWIGFDYDTGGLIHVHLHFQMVTGTDYCKEYIFPWNDILIEHRIMDNSGLYVPARELELIMFYMRTALKANDKKHISPRKHKEGFHYLRIHCDDQKIRFFLDKLFKENANVFYQLISKTELSFSDWHKIYLMSATVLRNHKRNGQVWVFFRHYYYKLYYTFASFCNQHLNTYYILKKCLLKSGFSICFIGVDGSGKSTVSKEISKWLSWKFETHSFYLGSGEGYHSFSKSAISFLNRLKKRNSKDYTKVQSQKFTKDDNAPIKVQHAMSLKTLVGILFSCFYSIGVVKHCKKELRKAYKYQKKGGIAIYDRFPQNQFAGIYDGPKIVKQLGDFGTLWIKLFARKEERIIAECQTFQPSIVFKLIISVDESIKRKHDAESIIKEKVEITKNLKFLHSEVFEIDAMQDYNSELLEIKRIIWAKIIAN